MLDEDAVAEGGARAEAVESIVRLLEARAVRVLGGSDVFPAADPDAPRSLDQDLAGYLQPRDLAKFGLLYLKDGVWDGKRILPEGWVKDSTTWHMGTDRGRRGYGYKWWVLSRKAPGTYEAYAGLGYGGQRLIVVPELDLIAVFTGWNIYDKPELDPHLALDRVLRAVKDRPAAGR